MSTGLVQPHGPLLLLLCRGFPHSRAALVWRGVVVVHVRHARMHMCFLSHTLQTALCNYGAREVQLCCFCLFVFKVFLKSQAELLSIADGASTARVDQGHNVRFLKVVLFQV